MRASSSNCRRAAALLPATRGRVGAQRSAAPSGSEPAPPGAAARLRRSPKYLSAGLFLGGDVAGGGHHRIGDKTGIAADRPLDEVAGLGVLLQIPLGVLAPLADALSVMR